MINQPFVDFYSVLRVKPSCDAKALECAYHDLLKMYHPDHGGTVDTDKFNRIIEAYRVLRNPDKRAEYDLLHSQNNPDEWESPPQGEGDELDVRSALADADDHARMLMFLYKKRRENAQSAGVVGYYIQKLLNCSDDTFEFHKWYLKEKGYIVVTEHGTLAITIEGIDHVISISRDTRAEKLMIAKSSPEEPGEAQA
jgi:curved DNA-binding protein